MPEIRTKIKLFDRDIDVVEVPIERRKETPSEYDLADGSKIRFGSIATIVYRIDGQWDAEGNPIYFVKAGQSVTVVSAPDEVRRRLTD
jgi:hypothetical protein